MYGLQIDKEDPLSMTKQLTNQIRHGILQGKLKGGDKLPPSRTLAQELKVARNVIIQTYEQLIAEGYLESRLGSGTFVAKFTACKVNQLVQRTDLGEFEKKEVKTYKDLIRFDAGNPDCDNFPRVQWARILKETCLESSGNTFGYGPVQGVKQLRTSLTEYLYRTKNIDCHPDQIIIVPGTTKGIDLLGKIFNDESAGIAIEDPSLSFIQNTFIQNGYQIHPIPVDHQGMQVQKLKTIPNIKMIYVVPSHQFPMGGVLPIGRRLALLDYARNNNAYILEDDYDSEYRYQGEPIQSLRHLDPECVIYLGTFSKIFSPSLRLGYIIAPTNIRNKICNLMFQLNFRTSTLDQLAMAEVIKSKLLDQHVYKMKKIYEKKRKHLIHSLQTAFKDKISITGENAGLHVLVSFSDHEFSRIEIEQFLENGVEIDWVEDYAIHKDLHKNKLVLGYGNLSLEQITIGVERLKKVYDSFQN